VQFRLDQVLVDLWGASLVRVEPAPKTSFPALGYPTIRRLEYAGR
jgi:hypothetical protein